MYRQNNRRTIGGTFRLATIIFVAAMLAFGASTVLYALHSTQQRAQDVQTRQIAERELCQTVDADHNRQRKQLIQNESLLYAVPAFKALVATPEAEHIAYRNARGAYNNIRKSRPSFCAQFAGNDVPPFPSLRDFRALKPLQDHHSIAGVLGRSGRTSTPNTPIMAHHAPVRVRPHHVLPVPQPAPRPAPVAPVIIPRPTVPPAGPNNPNPAKPGTLPFNLCDGLPHIPPIC